MDYFFQSCGLRIDLSLNKLYCREPELRDPVSELRRPQYLATGNAPIVSAFGDTVWGDGAVLIISKNLPLKGKFFEMVSWGGLGGLAPLRNLRYPCLAPRGASPPRNLRYPCLAPAARRADGEKFKNEPQGSYRPKNLTI